MHKNFSCGPAASVTHPGPPPGPVPLQSKNIDISAASLVT